MLKMRLLTFAVSAAPVALFLVKLACTKSGGMSDGGSWA